MMDGLTVGKVLCSLPDKCPVGIIHYNTVWNMHIDQYVSGEYFVEWIIDNINRKCMETFEKTNLCNNNHGPCGPG